MLFDSQQTVADPRFVHLYAQKVLFGCRQRHRDQVLAVAEAYFQGHGGFAIKQFGQINCLSVDIEPKLRPELLKSSALRRCQPAGAQHETPDRPASRRV